MSWDLLQRFIDSDVFNQNPFLPVFYLTYGTPISEPGRDPLGPPVCVWTDADPTLRAVATPTMSAYIIYYAPSSASSPTRT